jgi:hypothetical protein
MPSAVFHVMVMLPSFAFLFLVLATFYGARRAYLALSWVPAALSLLVNIFRDLSAYQPTPVNWPQLAQAVVWTGLAQCALGAGMVARDIRRGESCVGLLLATCLAAVPYMLRG